MVRTADPLVTAVTAVLTPAGGETTVLPADVEYQVTTPTVEFATPWVVTAKVAVPEA